MSAHLFSHSRRLWLPWLLVGVILACSLPISSAPAPAPTFMPVAPSPYPTYTPYPTYAPVRDEAPDAPTQCQPSITATVDVNVRKGPSKAYDTVGALMTGEGADVLGRSEGQFGEWWYIQYSAAPGGHGWVYGGAVRATCIPAELQVVAAPLLPNTNVEQPSTVPNPTDTESSPPGGGTWGVSIHADLAVTDLYADNWPNGKIWVRIANNGPDLLSNMPNNQLSCSASIHPYGISTGPYGNESLAQVTLSLAVGQTSDYDAGFMVDGTKYWYEVTCSIAANFKDDNPSNNSYSESFPPPP